VPNPTDTARALVDELENATKRLTLAEQAQSHFPIQRAMILRDEARAALLAYVDTLRIERDGFKELYEEWLTWAKGAVEKCKPEIPPSDSPQAQGIIDERLAHVAGVAQQLARYKEIYESNSAAFIAIRKAFGIEADETVVPYILKYAPPLATRPTEARDA
jgi:hypothetical protein